MAAVPIHASGSGLPFPTEQYPQMEQVLVREVETHTIRTVSAIAIFVCLVAQSGIE
jgi:hypothetical protein